MKAKVIGWLCIVWGIFAILSMIFIHYYILYFLGGLYDSKIVLIPMSVLTIIIGVRILKKKPSVRLIKFVLLILVCDLIVGSRGHFEVMGQIPTIGLFAFLLYHKNNRSIILPYHSIEIDEFKLDDNDLTFLIPTAAVLVDIKKYISENIKNSLELQTKEIDLYKSEAIEKTSLNELISKVKQILFENYNQAKEETLENELYIEFYVRNHLQDVNTLAIYSTMISANPTSRNFENSDTIYILCSIRKYDGNYYIWDYK